jgi:hypothetical protein
VRSIGNVHRGNAFSLADLEAMPDNGRRYELIGGAIVATAPKDPRRSPELQAVATRYS